MRMRGVIVAVVAAVLMPVAVLAQWSDQFDAYATGSIAGQGGWKGWDGVSAAAGTVSTTVSRSAPKSQQINSTSDSVRAYTGISSGAWIYTAYQYIPAGFTGRTYFILLNTYNDGGPYDWSVQLNFDAASGTVIDDLRASASVPFVRGAWAEIRVEFDLTANTISQYYNGALIASGTWTTGTPSVLNLAAVDLFGDTGSNVYYDDMGVARGRWALGLRHAPVGQASLSQDPGTRVITVSDLGASGQDGISIDTGDSEGLHSEIRLPAGGLPIGGKFHVYLRLGDIKGDAVVERTASGFRYTPDFSMAGSATYSFKLLHEGAVVYERGGVSGPVGTAAAMSEQAGICSHKDRDGILHTSQEIAATTWDVGGGVFVVADTIATQSDTPGPTGTGDLTVEYRASGIPGFEISAEFVMMFGVPGRMPEPHAALGAARFDAAATGLTISHLGSTGQDGVSIDFDALAGYFGIPPTKGINIEISPLALADGQTFRVAATGVFSGVPGSPLGQATLHRVGGSVQVGVDFGPIGTDQTRIDMFLSGTLVGTTTVATGTVGTFPGGLIVRGCGKQEPLPANPPCYIVFTNPSPFDPTGPVGPTMVDELHVLAASASGTIDQLSRYELTSTSGWFTIVGETPVFGSPPCPADLNGDGLIDFLDYLEFLNFYDVLDPRVDFNGDGLVDFGDYLEFLNHYDGGC